MSHQEKTPHCITYYESESTFTIDLDIRRTQGHKPKVQVFINRQIESLKLELQSPLQQQETCRNG